MATQSASPPQNTVALGAGFGIGILWWAMAITCLWSAWRGYDHGRFDWGLLWGMVGLLLAAAGTAAMFGTWWHLSRVAGTDDAQTERRSGPIAPEPQ